MANIELTQLPGYSDDSIISVDNDELKWIPKPQELLISGNNIKTLNGQSLLGSGNLSVIQDITSSTSSNQTGGYTWALYINSNNPHNQNVKCGKMWDANNILIGQQFVEIFGVFTGEGTYFLDDDDGGSHAGILLGVESDGTITGNTAVDSGSGSVTYSYISGIPITLYDLGVISRLHTSNKVILFWKGIPVGVKEFPSGNRKYSSSSAQGRFHIGAYDHQGAKFWVVYVRLMENGSPLDQPTRGYYPKKSSAHDSITEINSTTIRSFNGIWDFTNPYNTKIIPDLSKGKEVISGDGLDLHHGYLSNSNPNRIFFAQDLTTNNETPVYQQILFDQKPFTETPASPPSGALVYDDHTRADSTGMWSLITNAGSGQIGGSWLGGKSGVISKHLFLFELYQPVYKISPVADFEVTYTRANSAALRDSSHYELYAPKMIDDDNFISITFDPYGGFVIYDLTSRYGTGTQIGTTFSTPMSWSTLRVRFVGTQMQVYIDSTLVTTQTIPSRHTTSLRIGLMETTDLLRKLKSILIKAS